MECIMMALKFQMYTFFRGSTLFLIFFLYNLSFAQQTFFNTYKFDEFETMGNGYSVLQDDDNNFVAAGHISCFDGSNWENMVIIKTDENGNVLWQKKYADTSCCTQNTYKLLKAPGGGFFICINRDWDSSAVIIKTDSYGDSLLSFIIPGLTIQMDALSNGLVFTGADSTTIFITKTDFNGNIIFHKEYSTELPYNRIYSFITAQNGDFVISCSKDNQETIIKFDSEGELLWQTPSLHTNITSGAFVQETNDKGFFILSVIAGEIVPSEYFYNLWLRKLNESGSLLWDKTFSPFATSLYLTGFKPVPGDGFIISCLHYISKKYMYLQKLNSEGDSLWSVLINRGENIAITGNDISALKDGGFITTGQQENDSSNTYEFFLARLNSTGVTVIPEENYYKPSDFKLLSNYPNPFNPSTTISYSLPYPSDVEVIIYDIQGQEIKSFGKSGNAGIGSIEWNGTNNNGQPVTSGIYLYKVKIKSLVNGEVSEKFSKLVMMK